MFFCLKSLFVLKYNRYHTNKILCFNSFEYFIGVFFFPFLLYTRIFLYLKALKEIYLIALNIK
jgi:hypothetical protein